MVASGVNKCIKYALFAFNLAFVLIGIALFWIGVATLTNGLKYLQLIDTDSVAAPPKLFIAIGVIMFLIAFLGCCGAFMENHCMIMAYSVLVGLVLVLQLGVGIAAFTMGSEVENIAREGFNKTLQNYHNLNASNSVEIRRSWDMVQSDLKCCGVEGYKDWKTSDATVNGTLPGNDTLVPSSCCIGGAVDGCAKSITHANIDNGAFDNIIYTKGCLTVAVEHFAITSIGGVAIALAVVELLGVICACLLARSIRYSYETV